MKNNKFNAIFGVGVIPVIIIAFFGIMIVTGILYSAFRAKPDESIISVIGGAKVDLHKPEKVYIHDTVYVKVPQVCHREHVSSEDKPITSEPIKDNNDTNDENHLIN